MSVSDWYADLMAKRDETYANNPISPEGAGFVAADLLLPTDLINTINKAGRGEEVTGTDILVAGVDAVSTVLGLVTGGIGKIAGTGVKTALKGGQVVTSVAPFFIPESAEPTPTPLPENNDGTSDTDTPTSQPPASQNIIYVTTPNKNKTPTSSDSDGIAELLLMSIMLNGGQNKETQTPTVPTPAYSTNDNSKIILAVAGMAFLALIVAVVATRN